MVTPELIEYIKSRLAAGENVETIRTSLKQANWADQDIEEALKNEAGLINNEIQAIVAPKTNWFLRHNVLYSLIGVLLLVVIVGSVYWWQQIKKTNELHQAVTDQFADLDINGSAEYKTYVESIDKIGDQWAATEAQMKAKGSSPEDIELAKREFFQFFASTLLLKIKFEGTTMSNREKEAVASKLQQLSKDININLSVDTGCEYTEQKLTLQNFFVGATLKFKKPMVYVDWKEEQAKYCSPSYASAKYYSLESASQWNSTIFDKEGRGIKDYKIDPSVTFKVEGRFKLHSRSLFSEGNRDHYIIKDSNGVISIVPFFDIFDQYYKTDTVDDGEAGAELYKNGQYIGYVVSDIHSGGVWIHGAPIPQDVIDANTPEIPTSFTGPTSKRTEFMQRVAVAIGDGKIVNYTSQEIINSDLGKDLYTYKDGEVINDFGGKITIKKNGDKVSVIFDKIPKGEDCYEFYYINDPETYGFKESYIDGVLEEYDFTNSKNWNPIIDAFKQKVCFPANGTTTIEFRGNINDIKNAALWIKKRYDPKY